MSNENEKQSKRPSHIAYHVREGEDQKAYFNRVGSAWPHKDGEGLTVQLDSTPVDGRVTLRTNKERLEEMRGGKGGEREERDDRGGDREGERREPRREARRDAGPRYER